MKYYAKPELWVDEPCRETLLTESGGLDTGVDLGGEEDLDE